MATEMLRLPLPEPDDDAHPLDWYPGDEPESRTVAEVETWVRETLAYEDSRTADHGAVVGVVVERPGPCVHVLERERRRWDQRVYFFKCLDCGLIKIGTSHDYRKRRRQIERTTEHVLDILGTVFGDRSTEAHLHGTFMRDRVEGEWFRSSPALLRYIEDNAAPEPERRGRR
jgi:hypothetical protein